MNPLLKEIRHSPLLWMLIFVPLVLAVGGFHQPAEKIKADGWRWVDARTLTDTRAF